MERWRSVRGVDQSETTASGRINGLGWPVLAVGVVALVGIPMVMLLTDTQQSYIDLQVYRVGGQAWLHDVRLYGKNFPAPLDGPSLPFTYPPLAAVLFSAIAVMPWWLALSVVTGLGLVALAFTCVTTIATIDRRTARTLALGVGLAAACLALEPVRSTLSFGQVNLMLMGLVVADCLLPTTRWPRGVLIGLAAAIKLTPIVFIVFFLAKRQWRAAITSVACFVVLGLIGLVAAPQDTKDYWSGTLFDPQRIGGYALNTNQSIRGELHRLGMSGSPESLTWMMLSLAVVVLGGIAVRRACAAGNDVTALLLVAAVGLLVSPVSWSHHWVWIAPAVIVVGYGGWRARGARRPFTRARLITRFVVLMFLVSPIAFMPHGQNQELRWTWWQQLLGNTYLLIAVVFIAGTALRGWRLPQPADSAMGSSVAGPWGCADVSARVPDHPH